MKAKKYFIWATIALVSFNIGTEFNSWFYNVDSLYEANEFKREYIEYLDAASMKIDSIIDSHADDGECDELVDELNEAGYYKLIEKVDSMANTQL